MNFAFTSPSILSPSSSRYALSSAHCARRIARPSSAPPTFAPFTTFFISNMVSPDEATEAEPKVTSAPVTSPPDQETTTQAVPQSDGDTENGPTIEMNDDQAPTNLETETVNEQTGEPAPLADDPNRVKGILMLCLGNICRSPMAEAVMNRVLENRNLENKFFVDSCGTGGGSPNWYMDGGFSHHEGSVPDVRMQYAAQERGYSLTSRSRPLNKQDFEKFDYIIAMDSSNIESVETARQHWGVEEPRAKVMLMSEFSSDELFRGKGVPDPYYSGQDAFDKVLDMVVDSCNGLAEYIVK